MISLRSYLRLPDGSFTPVEECTQAPPDPDYVEGVIELSIDWKPIVTLDQWDYVDQLWAYLASMLEEVRASGRASTYFPDQPLVLRFERVGGGRLLVACGERKAATPEAEFVAAVRREGLRFFTEMDRLLPGSAGAYAEAVKSLTAV